MFSFIFPGQHQINISQCSNLITVSTVIVDRSIWERSFNGKYDNIRDSVTLFTVVRARAVREVGFNS